MATFPFEATVDEIEKTPEVYVKAVSALLESEFLVLPKGDGFIDYPIFDKGYEALKKATNGFTHIEIDTVWPVIINTSVSVVVLRSMLGFTPPEWAYVAAQRTGMEIDQNFARSLDRSVRGTSDTPAKFSTKKAERLRAMVETACVLLRNGSPAVKPGSIHRLDKADTNAGPAGIQTLAAVGVPYSMLLYERFLGRPFAGHRDAVSGLVGDNLENKIEEALAGAGISFEKTKRAQRVPGFDQAPDFIIPSHHNPKVVIEAKITEDDGTARDKITRVQRLGLMSMEGVPPGGNPKFQVVACVGGRGFGVRREDMKKLLLTTRGKVFTLKQLDKLIDYTDLAQFRTKKSPPVTPPVVPDSPDK